MYFYSDASVELEMFIFVMMDFILYDKRNFSGSNNSFTK